MESVIMQWLRLIQQHDGIPPKEVIAFNFGLFEGEEGYEMCLVGGFEYDEDDDDWACLEMPAAEYRYLLLPKKAQALAYDEILDHCVDALKSLEAQGKLKNNILANAQAITIGLDDGPLVKIR